MKRNDHYMGLAADISGHSQDAMHWARVIPFPIVQRPELTELNVDISIDEVIDTLKRLKRNKAPGPDSIPVEFFQMFACTSAADDATSRPIRHLTAILQELWGDSYVPDSLNMASLISIFKKDDPTKPGNYRGISLIDSLIKILITLLTGRLQTVLEEKSIFIKGQGGFRSKEESVAQALALYEIVKRRQNVHLDTFALFLDYQKAFDTVPHEGLFRKMELMGIRGKMLAFVRSLYRNSSVKVRANDGSHSDSFRLLRGVRQGCPMSPVLFDIYINDMFDGCEHGCQIPISNKGGDARYLPDAVPGLLFADDAALLSGTAEDLASSLQSVCSWSDRMELSFGIDKCGLLCFNGILPPNNPETIFGDKTIWQINGQTIPVVDHYTYLGLDFYADLDLKKMITPRTEKGRRVLNHFAPFFKCPTIPYTAKLTILRSIVVSTMLYGAEIWGMRVKRGEIQQTLINRALRWILNFRGPITLLSIGAMHSELRVVPFKAQIATRRARGYIKFPTLNTWIATLCANPLRLRVKNWFTITEQWLNRFIKANVGKSSIGGNTPFLDNIKASIQLTRKTISDSTIRSWGKSAPHLSDYFEAGYLSLTRMKSWSPFFGNGLGDANALQWLLPYKTNRRQSASSCPDPYVSILSC